tara:strand:- start:106 stop:378 length:273 start_codon:yes stop_codon:yes gene_type:complete
MTKQRPWTAIVSEGSHITAINVSASIESDTAKVEVEQQHPGKSVVALIPGEHAMYTRTFCRARKMYIGGTSAKYIDPFDTEHIHDIGDAV